MTENLIQPGPDDLMWWGYKHTQGSLHLKRYFEPLDILEARESPFCDVVVGPFRANNWNHANEQLRELLGEPLNTDT